MRVALALTAAMALLTTAALAQISPFRGSQFVLVDSDREAMSAAANSLLENGTPEEGAVAEWSNDETRSHGKVTIMQVTQEPVLCVNVVYEIQLVRPADPRLFDVRSCRTEAGEWKIVAPGSRLPSGKVVR